MNTTFLPRKCSCDPSPGDRHGARLHAAGTTWYRQVASAVRQPPERRDPYASTFAYCTSNPLLQLPQLERSVLLQVIWQHSWLRMLGVRVRGVGIGDEARFGHGGVSLSAIAALSVPSTLQGVNPEMGLMRTMLCYLVWRGGGLRGGDVVSKAASKNARVHV